MRTRTEIRMNFKQTLQQADMLDRVGDKLDRLADRTLEDSMQMLAVAWKGENASAFLNKENRLKGNIKETGGAIHEIAEDIRRIARRVYEAEMEALRIAESRHS